MRILRTEVWAAARSPIGHSAAPNGLSTDSLRKSRLCMGRTCATKHTRNREKTRRSFVPSPAKAGHYRDVSGGRDFLQQGSIAEQLAGADDHGGQRILGEHDAQTGFALDVCVELPQERHSAGEHQPALVEIAAELGRYAFERVAHGLDDGADRLGEGVTHLGVGDHDRSRNAFREVTALDLYP